MDAILAVERTDRNCAAQANATSILTDGISQHDIHLGQDTRQRFYTNNTHSPSNTRTTCTVYQARANATANRV